MGRVGAYAVNATKERDGRVLDGPNLRLRSITGTPMRLSWLVSAHPNNGCFVLLCV